MLSNLSSNQGVLIEGKVASLGRVWNLFFSDAKVFTCSQTKNFSNLITGYSRLDKLSLDDATLPPVRCRTPQLNQMNPTWTNLVLFTTTIEET